MINLLERQLCRLADRHKEVADEIVKLELRMIQLPVTHDHAESVQRIENELSAKESECKRLEDFIDRVNSRLEHYYEMQVSHGSEAIEERHDNLVETKAETVPLPSEPKISRGVPVAPSSETNLQSVSPLQIASSKVPENMPRFRKGTEAHEDADEFLDEFRRVLLAHRLPLDYH